MLARNETKLGNFSQVFCVYCTAQRKFEGSIQEYRYVMFVNWSFVDWSLFFFGGGGQTTSTVLFFSCFESKFVTYNQHQV